MSRLANSGMSSSWIRPVGADSVGVPSNLYYTATQSALGTQVRASSQARAHIRPPCGTRAHALGR